MLSNHKAPWPRSSARLEAVAEASRVDQVILMLECLQDFSAAGDALLAIVSALVAMR